jgi:exodeoxyribonuclease-5
MRVEQVICGLNDTRRETNNLCRKLLGYGDRVLPDGRKGEKLICEKNIFKYGLTNGESVTISNDPAHPIQEVDSRSFTAWIRPTFEPERLFFKAHIYRGHFDDSANYDKDRVRVDSSYKRHLVELDWGFCITCHKAQGGQYSSVLIRDDCRGTRMCPDKETHRRWLYTAVTRACKSVIIRQER